MDKNDSIIKKKKEYINQAIDFENGEGFHKNINQNGSFCFFSGNSFCVFKVVNVENVNCCYIKYLYGQDKETLKNVFLGVLNYIINRKVKFIYYSRKITGMNYYSKFFESFGFTRQVQNNKFKYNFKCKECENDVSIKEPCSCDSEIFFI